MLVSKKKYNTVLYRNIELEKEIEWNTQELSKYKTQIIHLKKEYKLIEKIYHDIKSELNQTISMSNTLEELKSQKEIIELDIIYENKELNLLKEKGILLSSELENKAKELVGKSHTEIIKLEKDLQNLSLKKESTRSAIKNEDLKLLALKKEILSSEEYLKNVKLNIEIENIKLNSLQEESLLLEINAENARKKLIEKFDVEIQQLNMYIQNLQIEKEHLASNVENENLKAVSIKQDILLMEKELEYLYKENMNKLESNTNLNLKIEENTKKQISIEKSVENLSEQYINLLKKVETENQEITRISENKHLKISILERELLQNLQEKIRLSNIEITRLTLELKELEKELFNKEIEFEEFKQLKKSVVLLKEEKDLQEVAFYKNIFSFNTTEKFKEKMNQNIKEQKELIKDKKVINSKAEWTLNGSVREGRKMTDLNIKLMIRSYNTECDNAISNMRYSTFDNAFNRIIKSRIALDKLNEKNGLFINENYQNLKLEELRLVFELKLFEKNEKEKLRAFREEEREKKRVEQEIKDKLNKLSLHEKQIQLEINSVNKELARFNGENVALLNKIKHLQDSLSLISKKRAEVNRRQVIGKSGYVYIISNVGTMGENIYKIGMTRRLEPADRIKELSGASVPFEYDVHAMILTDDAPLLESHLHSVFHSSRVNLINNRKEFFAITLDEIKKEVFTIVGKDIVFKDVSYASQYFETLSMRNKKSKEINELDILLKMH